MNKKELETKSYQELSELYFQFGGVIDINHYATRDELIDAILTGNKFLGSYVEDEGVLY